jgi:glutaredoxin 3
MTKVVIYSTARCPYCVQAKQLLDQKQVKYEEIRIDTDPEKSAEMITRSGRKSVPQIFINDHHIGGFDDLYAANKTGKLDSLLYSS